MPGDILRIGEVGELRNGCFERHKSLLELGIDFREEQNSPDEIFTHASATQRTTAVGTELRGAVEGGLRFEFDKRGQFVLSARRVQQRRIANIDHVCNQIVRHHELGKWDPSWVVVEQVWTAEFLMVLISRSRKGGVTLSSTTGEIPGIEALSDPALDIGLVDQSGEILHERGPNKTPFFSARRLKRRLFANNTTEQISTRGLEDDTVDVFELDFEEDLMGSWADSEEV
jgi:hypothetical protein